MSEEERKGKVEEERRQSVRGTREARVLQVQGERAGENTRD